MAGPDDTPYWQTPLPRLFQDLESGPEGLPLAEASKRLARLGPNSLRPQPKRALLWQFLSRFRNPLVLLLLAASAVSALTQDFAGFVTIVTMVLLSVTLDFFQEHRAGQAAERLKQSVSLQSSVLRSGTKAVLPASQLVPGDVIFLAAGDLVPADARLLEAKDFFVNQALLSGEPYPVEKSVEAEPGPEEAGLAPNSVYMGTAVVSGSARALVCRTGPRTAMGEISEHLRTSPPPTSFERGINQFGLLILRVTILLVLFVLLVNTLFQRPLLESFLFAVALAVGLTPELLPMVVSVTLARGAIRMSRARVIVKRLSAIQDLGSMDVLCTDKTGTLTEAKIRLEKHVDPRGRETERVLLLAYLNSYFESGLRSPLDEAILAHEHLDIGAWKKVDEVPFDFERRRVSVLVENAAERMLIVKGAPEETLRLCTHYETGEGGASAPIEPSHRAQFQELFETLSAQGFRLLAIAWHRASSDHAHAVLSDEAELVFAGYAAFLDPPKASAGEAIADLHRNGVTIKLLTGDNELVTRYICGELGVPIRGVLTGAQLQAMGEEALLAQVERCNLFCRVNPAQKERILRALKKRGHVVGFLGDGVNDAPSLHSADVGISVDGAVDVAKEAADMILLQHDLEVLNEGIREGRRTYGNVLKYVLMGTSSNFGNMFSMAGATLFLPFLPMLPVQILLNNLMYDLSEVTIPLDSVDEEELARPHRWDMGFIRRFMWTVGPVSSLFDFLTFWLMLRVFRAGEALFHTGWFLESIATQVLVIFIIRTRRNPLRSRPNRWLLLSSLGIVFLAFALPYLPLSSHLGFVPLPGKFYFILAPMVLAYLAAVEVVKRRFFR
ncbi:MAG: magnesium-translocating P-type ATPase [bacterium]